MAMNVKLLNELSLAKAEAARAASWRKRAHGNLEDAAAAERDANLRCERAIAAVIDAA